MRRNERDRPPGHLRRYRSDSLDVLGILGILGLRYLMVTWHYLMVTSHFALDMPHIGIYSE